MGYNNDGCCGGGMGFPFMNGAGFGGFGYEWIIMLLFFGMFGWGGGGFGWGGGFGGRGLEQATTTAAETAALVGQQQVADRVAGIATGVDAVAGIVTANGVKVETVKDAVTNGFYANQRDLCQLGNNIAQQFASQTMNNMQNHNNLTAQLTDMRFANQQCCCDTKQLIQSSFCDLRHELAMSKCDTDGKIAAGTAAIMARIDGLERNAMQDKLDAANEKIATLKAERDNSQQTQTLLAAIQAPKAPAWPVAAAWPTPCAAPAYPYGFVPQQGCCNPCGQPNACEQLAAAIIAKGVDGIVNPTTPTTAAAA